MRILEQIRAELTEDAGVVARWGGRTFGVVFALHLLGAAYGAVAATSGSRFELAQALLVAGIGQVLLWGAGVGSFALLCRLAGWAVLVPVTLVPLGVLGSCWVWGTEMTRSLNNLGEVAHASPFLGWMAAQGWLAPPAIVLLLPLVLLALLVTPTALGAAIHVVLIAWMIVVMGATAGVVVSAPILAFAVLRRLGRRAAARTEAMEPELAIV